MRAGLTKQQAAYRGNPRGFADRDSASMWSSNFNSGLGRLLDCPRRPPGRLEKRKLGIPPRSVALPRSSLLCGLGGPRRGNADTPNVATQDGLLTQGQRKAQ